MDALEMMHKRVRGTRNRQNQIGNCALHFNTKRVVMKTETFAWVSIQHNTSKMFLLISYELVIVYLDLFFYQPQEYMIHDIILRREKMVEF